MIRTPPIPIRAFYLVLNTVLLPSLKKPTINARRDSSSISPPLVSSSLLQLHHLRKYFFLQLHHHCLSPTSMRVVPSEQIKQLKDIFTRFDMDSDGSLTHLELAALLRSLGIKPTGDQIHSLLSGMDSNGNGLVEFDELVEAITLESSQETMVDQGQLMEVFRSFDRDGNGYITAAELACSMAKMGHPLTFRELTEMFREADTDGDGVISFTEFTSVMAKSAADFLGFSIS